MNNDDFPINDLAEEVNVNGGEISFNKMKDPNQDLKAQCFAEKGAEKYISSSILVKVDKEGDYFSHFF